MTKESYNFEKLPFSKLFKTYTSEFSSLKNYFSANPFSEDEVRSRANLIEEKESHTDYVASLKEFHAHLDIEQSEQLKKLGKKESLAIVTGQQLGIYGGPLFTIYKTISTILLAKEWEKKLSKPVVPVFWLADEDHDFEEIAWFGIPGNEEFSKLEYEGESDGKLVSDVLITEKISKIKESIKTEMFDTDFSDDLWKLFDACFKTGVTFRKAFAQMMDELFGKHGLLIVGSNFKSIKEIVADTFVDSISNADTINSSLQNKSDDLAKEFHQQVVLGDSNLFYIDEKKGRIKIERNGSDWKAASREWTEAELTVLIKNNPEKFSPNVFLRPVIQDQLLPTLGYVAGPGEVAYYGQMKSMYPEFGLEMPVIFPRFSATLIESGIDRIMDKIPFEFNRYGERIEDLEKEYAKRSESTDVEALFREWKLSIKKGSENPTEMIKEIDGSLEGLVGKTVSGFETELDKLKGRVYRSIKQQEQTQLQRIRKIKAQLYPDNGLQERMVSFMYFMNKYGIGIWDELIIELEKEPLQLDTHHLIRL
ncbi:MAG: bacillithiol biosynthesis cysteine-adding enzyme BshC [Balneola sp.]